MPAGIVPVSKVSVDDDRNLDSLPNNDLVKIRIGVKVSHIETP